MFHAIQENKSKYEITECYDELWLLLFNNVFWKLAWWFGKAGFKGSLRQSVFFWPMKRCLFGGILGLLSGACKLNNLSEGFRPLKLPLFTCLRTINLSILILLYLPLILQLIKEIEGSRGLCLLLAASGHRQAANFLHISLVSRVLKGFLTNKEFHCKNWT